MSISHLTVIGTGYLGATHAACMAELGYHVLGVDIDEAKVASLNEGKALFHEPGLNELLARNIKAGRLSFTTSYEEAGAFADMHFICVGTPQRKDSQAADMTYVYGSFESLAPHLRPGSLIVGKSTVPAGTAQELHNRIARLDIGAELAWNPEFLREGFAVQDTLRPDRLVVGAQSVRAETLMREVYKPITDAGSPFLLMDYATAELVKVAANAYLATKISFINAMAEICEVTGGDVTKLAEAIGHDDRIGKKFLRAGIGFGGGCLPKDIRAFQARAAELGVGDSLTFLSEVDKINLRRRTKIVDMARTAVGGNLAGKKVTILGVTFKPDSDDIRDSPALDIAQQLQAAGAAISVHDPAGMDNAQRHYPLFGYHPTAAEAAKGADVVLHLTEWDEYQQLDLTTLGQMVGNRHIIDGRNALEREKWTLAGWTYQSLGRP